MKLEEATERIKMLVKEHKTAFSHDFEIHKVKHVGDKYFATVTIDSGNFLTTNPNMNLTIDECFIENNNEFATLLQRIISERVIDAL